MIVYTEEDLQVLIDLASDLDMESQLREAFRSSNGTLQGTSLFNNPKGQEFLAAKFEDVPKYIGAPFRTLIKWRLMIGG